MSAKREYWVDYVKVFACMLVMLGHFFQSMVKAGILANSAGYQWFNTTLYYFHVPLFFICSGYLYQRYSRVDSVGAWGRSVSKKALTLGLPYFAFSLATWVLKTVFAGSVNEEAGGLIETLFFRPASPYWYLYILFFLFLLTPSIRDRKGAVILAVAALAAKAARIVFAGTGLMQVYAVAGVLDNAVWFASGMLMGCFGADKLGHRAVGAFLGAVFLILSIALRGTENRFAAFGLGVLACAAVILFMRGAKQVAVIDRIAAYTMPIFLMHTLFAAALRSALIKLGLSNAAIHIAAGIAISLIGPIAAMRILEAIKLDFLVYPGRLLRRK